MIAKIYSWLLASAWLAWGILLLFFIPRFHQAYLGFAVPMPFPMRVMVIAGPIGCLLIAVMIATGVVLNAHRFRVRFMSLILTIGLLAWVGYFTNVVFPTFTNQMA